MPTSHHFASDNYAGVHPEILDAIVAANHGHDRAYGDDALTARFADCVREHFGPYAEGFPVLNGTGANVLALQAVTPRWGAVVCTDVAHINTDETGAPEHVGGVKLLAVPSVDGRMPVDGLRRAAESIGSVHAAQPTAVSITQVTELGTCYGVDELAELVEAAHGLGLPVHLDGARLANAAVHLGVGLGDLTTALGVDVVSLGATKMGALAAEAVIVPDTRTEVGSAAASALPYLRKSSLQLASKGRFLSAQLLALYGSDLWRNIAGHGNEMAALLADRLRQAGVLPSRPVQSNAVFVVLTEEQAARGRAVGSFYTWDSAAGEVRLMTSFDTTPAEVEALAAAIAG